MTILLSPHQFTHPNTQSVKHKYHFNPKNKIIFPAIYALILFSNFSSLRGGPIYRHTFGLCIYFYLWSALVPFIMNRLKFILFVYTSTLMLRVGLCSIPQELVRGFIATPNPSVSSFQPILTDSNGNYSLGFNRVDSTKLALVIIHVHSSEQMWIANRDNLARWSDPTQLIFNGSLVIVDSHSGVFWSTNSNGDRVWLSNTSNLEIQNLDGSQSVVWQSIDFPSDTLVENQNLSSYMTLVSSNGLYTMRLGFDFIGLYAKLGSGQMYWKHKAMEAKADIIEGGPPIFAQLNSDGFLGMYQNGSVPVDVQSFYSFQQPGLGNRRIRLETDGNLKGYYWTGSRWILDYQAIFDPCELPSACGSYGLCQQGKGCSCLDNRTEYSSVQCISSEIISGDDFCTTNNNKYRVLRKSRVDLPYKELMHYEKMESLDHCESACEGNCTCWGVVYSNSSGFCYNINYPIQTLLQVGDDTKVGYFKLKEGVGRHRMGMSVRLGVGLLCGIVLLWVVGWVGWYSLLNKNGGANAYGPEVCVGPYKDLGSASFKSIQLSER